MLYDDRIYAQAVKGTAINPKGLPPVLASLVAAQAAHETGNFSSNIFKSFNNAFGYSYFPGSQYQSGSGTIADNGQPVAAYQSIEDSTRELVDWIYRRVAEGRFPADLSKITTPEYYAQLLKQSNFYTDTLSNYTAGIKRYFVNVLTDLQNNPVKLFTLLALGFTIYWIVKKSK